MEYDASFQSHERDIRFRLASECMEQILEKKKKTNPTCSNKMWIFKYPNFQLSSCRGKFRGRHFFH